MSWLRLSCMCDVEPCQYGVRKCDKWPVKRERRRCSECPELKGVSMRGSIKALEEIIVRSAVAAQVVVEVQFTFVWLPNKVQSRPKYA